MPMSPLRRHARSASTVAVAAFLLSLPAPAVRAQGRQGTAAAGPAAPATVRSIARTALPRGDRITIEFSREVTYLSDRVPNPDRLYFDFSKAVLTGAATDRAQAIAGTLVKKVRAGQNSATTLRVVVELGPGSPRYSAFLMYSPFRLVIDVEQPAPTQAASPVVKASAPGAPGALDASARLTPAVASGGSLPPLTLADLPATPVPTEASLSSPDVLLLPRVSTDTLPILNAAKPITLSAPAAASSTSRGTYSLGRQLGLGVSRIVIDPGHGGRDPGAQSNGIDESELVLDVSLRLEALLKAQPGIDVVLTRRTDEFIPLQERTAIANRAGADLLLSIHANAAVDPQLRGVETYFLNFASNPGAEGVAARENATSDKTMGSLPDLVKAITLNNKVAESRELAGMVQTSMTRELAARNKTIRDLGVKQAPFVVLIGAQMPSVLAEISFLTNRGEAALLKQAAYRQSIAQALFDAVTRYQGSLKRSVAPTPTAKGGS